MIQRFYTNRLSKELNEFMRIGSEVVYYKDHLAEIAEKDKEIKRLHIIIGRLLCEREAKLKVVEPIIYYGGDVRGYTEILK